MLCASVTLFIGISAHATGNVTDAPVSRSTSAPQSAAVPANSHVFKTSDGVRLWYREAGQPNGTPVVFLHGGPGEGSQTFARYAGPELEQHLRMIYLDQRGSGRSQRPKNSSAYSINRMVQDIEELRIQLGVQRIDIIGHSFGTILALEYAARYPEHVSRLVLAGTANDMPALMDSQCRRLESSDPVAYTRAVKAVAGVTFPRCDPFEAYQDQREQIYIDRNMFPDIRVARMVEDTDSADGLGNSGESFQALLNKGLTRYRFVKFARISMPVLIIAGELDFQTPVEVQRALARNLQQATLLIYSGSGHFMFVEQPVRFGRDVGHFLAEQ
ncbi:MULTISPECIES: alpha/beta fold hydrolase [Paraburkholderia]|uniref:alpha/beta fold hydrolase n=1 Tax=Paraburkholderia TaxID=1822464 RepID=UPI0022596883|nr:MULTISPECIES: alpha/beta hydrolase [Paraburkholderia]MCX4163894.1 alpha/beta hydrolase [Paraburkholderia megapolitana]MDN7159389.1 alpha/beta hydrolase [Paraburkholderia sp. CHISQ3]MDQ6496436.1 alpha/beta hydrolase [Paraburkholderia megapolitana]